MSDQQSNLESKIDSMNRISLQTILLKVFNSEMLATVDGDVMYPRVYPVLRIFEHFFIGLVPLPDKPVEEWPVAFHDDEDKTQIFGDSLKNAVPAFLASLWDADFFFMMSAKEKFMEPIVMADIVKELWEHPEWQALVRDTHYNFLINQRAEEKSYLKAPEISGFYTSEKAKEFHAKMETLLENSIYDGWDSEQFEEVYNLGIEIGNEDFKEYLAWLKQQVENT